VRAESEVENAAVQIGGKGLRLTAGGRHHVQPRITVDTIGRAQVGDVIAVGAKRGRALDPLIRGQTAQAVASLRRPVGRRGDEPEVIGVARVGMLGPAADEHGALAVGRPGRLGVVEGARGQPPALPLVQLEHADVISGRLGDVAIARILLVLPARDDPRLRLTVAISGGFIAVDDAQQPVLARRQAQCIQSLLGIGHLQRFTEGSDRQAPELARARAIRQEIEPIPVGRPARRRCGRIAGGHGPRLAAIDIDDMDPVGVGKRDPVAIG